MGERAAFVQADVTAEGDVTHALDAAAELGALDIVVNCAGAVTASWVVGKKGPYPLADFRRVIEINLIGSPMSFASVER